jgi:adenine phosphoribosyltransferase
VSLAEEVRAVIRDVLDFPQEGILFRDISPLLADAVLFERVTDWMVEHFRRDDPTHVVAIESRGFIFGAPVAHRLGAGFVPARKPGKLPGPTKQVEYNLEYGSDALEIHDDAFGAGARVVVVDDLLATGGTAWAACQLVEALGAHVAGVCVALELGGMPGRERLSGYRVESLLAL